MSGCEALIFDVDGTLADTEEAHRRAFNSAFSKFGLNWSWDSALYGELLLVTGGKERMHRYIASLSVPQSERSRLLGLVPALHALKTRRYHELIAGGHVPLRPGVAGLMIQARSAGVRLGIASTTSPENIEALIASGLGEDALAWFDTIAAGDVVAKKKPAPDIYNAALQALRVSPSSAVAIEDSALGVTAAKAAGLFTVATPSQWTSTEDLTAADVVMDSLAALSFDRLAALHAASKSGENTHAEAH
jgi:HAD superfamily hydrolase (TIGR01509 family)